MTKQVEICGNCRFFELFKNQTGTEDPSGKGTCIRPGIFFGYRPGSGLVPEGVGYGNKTPFENLRDNGKGDQARIMEENGLSCFTPNLVGSASG